MDATFYSFKAKSLQGKEVGMDSYKGKTILVVIISEHRHPIFRLKIRSVFRSITTQNMVRMA